MSQESNLPAKPSVKVRGWVDPFHPQATAFGCVMAGTSIADAISKACKAAGTRKRYMRRGLVYLGRKTPQGGYKWTRIPQSAWNKVRLKPNDSLTFRLLPEGGGGGKNPFRTILNIVVMAVAVVAAVVTAGASIFATGGALAGATITGGLTVGGLIAGSLVGGLVMTMGQYLVDAIAPIKQPNNNTIAADDKDIYSVSSASNTIDKWGYIPILFGKGRVAPKKAAAPYTELNGDDMYLHELFIWGECGTGDIAISNLKFGETSVEEYDDVDIETWRFDPNEPHYSQWYPTGVNQQEFSVKLTNKTEEDKESGKEDTPPNWVTRTSTVANAISVDIIFNTLVKFNDRGDAEETSVTFNIQYSIHVDGEDQSTKVWLDAYYVDTTKDPTIATATKDFTVKAKSTSAVRRTFYITEKNGKRVGDGINSYDIRICRVTEDHDSEDKEDTKIQDDAYWTGIRTHSVDKPFTINYPAVFTAIRVKATDQLNGAIQNLTGDYQVIMKNYNQNTGKWEMSATRDLVPAIRFVLQECNARPQPDTVIDWDNLIETDKYWKSVGWKYDKVLDNQTSVLSMVQDICAAGLGSPTFIDGKWAVIVDKPREEVVMGITSANSWGWSVDRHTMELPHIIQCDFVNEQTWEADLMEITVDGSYIDEGRTPIVEKVSFDGVTVPDNIYKQARFHYADAKMQKRTISMTMWDESLVATRGDLVALSQPYLVPTGLESGRVKSVTLNEDGYITAITTDIVNGIRSNLGVKIYLSDGKIAHGRLSYSGEEGVQTRTLELLEPLTANIKRGDKYVLGDYGEENFLGVITSMKFNADFSCQITCVDYIEDKYEVFDPDFVIPEWHSTITKSVTSAMSLSPAPMVFRVVTDEGALLRIGNTLKTRAMFYFSVPGNIDPRAYHIRGQYRISNTTDDASNPIPGKWSTFMTIPISETIGYCDNVEDMQTYDFRFQYVSIDGKTSAWTYKLTGDAVGTEGLKGVYIIGKTQPPPVIEELLAEVDLTRGVHLTWSPLEVLDFHHYSVVMLDEGVLPIPSADLEKTATITIDNQLWIMPYGQKGDITFGVYGVDTLGNMSETITTVMVEALPPKTPVLTYTSTPEGGVIQWDDCKTIWDIDHYVVEDIYNNFTHDTIDHYHTLTPRKSGSVYSFNVTAVDIYGTRGETAQIEITIGAPAAPKPTVRIDDIHLVIQWEPVVATFSVDSYEVYEDGTLLGSIKGTEFRIAAPLPSAGSLINAHSYSVYAVDIAGNRSAAGETSIEIAPPSAPTNVLAVKNGSECVITWEASASTVTISHYRVLHRAIDNNGKTIIQQYKLGDYDTTRVSIPALTVGRHIFTVSAINFSGTEGEASSCEFVSIAPPPVNFTDCSPVDNNVMMRYSIDSTRVFWPIKEYRVFEVEKLTSTVPVTAEVGKTDTQFFADIKLKGGVYTYGIIAVDVANNESEMVTRSVTVNQPPNFVLYTDKNSTFNGEKTNMLLDGVGGMYGPIEFDDTWALNISRVANALSISEASVTWQKKVDNNMGYYFSPHTTGSDLVGSYQEIIDLETIVPSSTITVTVTSDELIGDPIMTQVIEISDGTLENGEMVWETLDTTGKSLAKNFRYVRITLQWSGGVVYVTDIHFQLSSTEISDAGSVILTDADYDIDDPAIDETDDEPIGKLIRFNKTFMDIIGFTGLTVRGIEPKQAFVVFKDRPNPTWFRIFILDKNGNRTTGQVDWSVKGV